MHGDEIIRGGGGWEEVYMGGMRQYLKAAVEGRNCAVIVQPPLERRSERCRDTVEMINPNESREGKWNEHVRG